MIFSENTQKYKGRRETQSFHVKVTKNIFKFSTHLFILPSITCFKKKPAENQEKL